MAVVTVYRHGGKAGVQPARWNPVRPKRGSIEGWSKSAARRNTEFLQSVDLDSLTGRGVTFTLTLRDCPPTPADWHRLRRAFIERLRRRGFTRMHWVTEWQRRGVPHLHGVVWFDDVYDLAIVVRSWLAVAAPYGAGERGQHTAPLSGALGWLQYLAKHAARGVQHYQRTALNAPTAWLGKTGRMWGHLGNWDLVEPRKFGVDDAGFFRLRRMVRAWRLADARTAREPRRILLARGAFRSPDPQLSRLRGYSEWMPDEAVQIRMLAHLAEAGHLLFDTNTGEVVDLVKGTGSPSATAGSGADSGRQGSLLPG